MSKNIILFFVRWPELGQVKTRLAKSVGEEDALEIHTKLAQICFQNALEVKNAKTILSGTGESLDQFEEWLPGADDYWLQPKVGLGERLSRFFKKAFDRGAEKVVAIGSDAPLLKAPDLESAINALEHHEVSLLPAEDGGYVLIGMNKFHAELFERIPWGTERVFEETTKVCDFLMLDVHIGDEFRDVDYEEDWLIVSSELDL